MSNILGPQVGYIEMVNHFTQEINNERASTPSTYFPLRPSAAGKCARELGFELMEYLGEAKYEKPATSPETSRLLNFGSSVEYHVLREFENAFRKAAKPIEIRYRQQTLSFFKLPNGQRVEGNIDLVLVSEKFKCVADIKSKKDKWSYAYKSSWDELSDKLTRMESVQKFGDEAYWVNDLPAFLKELDDPFFAANFYQLNLYFYDDHHFLREKGVDHAAIFQYSKNDSRLREIRFRPSTEAYEYVKTKFTSVFEIVSRTKNPMEVPAEHVLGSAKCAFCSFNKQCHPQEDALKTHFKTYPPKRWPKDLNRLDEKLATTLNSMFTEYASLSTAESKKEQVEREIIKLLDREKLTKVRLDDGHVYEVKTLKSGGVGGGPRKVLRRGKA